MVDIKSPLSPDGIMNLSKPTDPFICREEIFAEINLGLARRYRFFVEEGLIEKGNIKNNILSFSILEVSSIYKNLSYYKSLVLDEDGETEEIDVEKFKKDYGWIIEEYAKVGWKVSFFIAYPYSAKEKLIYLQFSIGSNSLDISSLKELNRYEIMDIEGMHHG